MFLSRFPRRDALGTATSFSMQQDTGRQNQLIADRDAQLLADCHAMVSTRSIWLVECAKPVSGQPVDQAHSHAHKQQLADDVARYGRRVAATPAFTSLGLQNKRAIVGLLLAELTDDPSPVCDQLLLSLLSDLDGICAHIGNSASAVLLQEHPDGGLIEACRHSLEQIEEFCSECIRVGALPRPQEQKQLTDTLMSMLMKTRRLLANVAGMTASSVDGIQMKGCLLRRMMTIGEADVHYERLALAQSFVADIASLEPHLSVEDEVGDRGPHWWTNFTSRIWRSKGGSASPSAPTVRTEPV